MKDFYNGEDNENFNSGEVIKGPEFRILRLCNLSRSSQEPQGLDMLVFIPEAVS